MTDQEFQAKMMEGQAEVFRRFDRLEKKIDDAEKRLEGRIDGVEDKLRRYQVQMLQNFEKLHEDIAERFAT